MVTQVIYKSDILCLQMTWRMKVGSRKLLVAKKRKAMPNASHLAFDKKCHSHLKFYLLTWSQFSVLRHLTCFFLVSPGLFSVPFKVIKKIDTRWPWCITQGLSLSLFVSRELRLSRTFLFENSRIVCNLHFDSILERYTWRKETLLLLLVTTITLLLCLFSRQKKKISVDWVPLSMVDVGFPGQQHSKASPWNSFHLID